MPLQPYERSDEVDGRSSVFVKGFIVVTAMSSCCLLALAFLIGSARAPAGGVAEVALLIFIGAAASSFIGSVGCIFAIPKTKTEEPWLRWCAIANYCALATIIGIPMVQSYTSHYR